MTTYYYNPPTGGYLWNLIKRCLWEVGIEPSGLATYDGKFNITFSRDLTATEKTKLDTLMTSSPTYPKPGDLIIFKIKDIWGGENGANFETFKTACGLPNLKLYYTESVLGSGIIDTIELHHPTTLTTTQKTTVKTQYTALFT